jgi:hypothetical protein
MKTAAEILDFIGLASAPAAELPAMIDVLEAAAEAIGERLGDEISEIDGFVAYSLANRFFWQPTHGPVTLKHETKMGLLALVLQAAAKAKVN